MLTVVVDDPDAEVWREVPRSYFWGKIAGMSSGRAGIKHPSPYIKGLKEMKANRKTEDKINLCNGPGKLCQALSITMNQHDKELGEVEVYDIGMQPEVVKTTRIGISFSQHLKWRYYIKGSSYISKK